MATDYLKMLKKSQHVPVYTELPTLDLYCEYLLNYDNKLITYSNLSNLRDMFDRIDEKSYKNNESKLARFFFIKYFLEARLKDGIMSIKMALQYTLSKVSKKYQMIIDKEILKNVTPNTMSKQDIQFMNNMIFSQLNLFMLRDYREAIMKVYDDLDNDDLGRDSADGDNVLKLFQNLVNELSAAQRRAKKETRFNLKDDQHFNALMLEAIKRVKSEAHYLKTGWQGLNNMLDGGFEDGRVYNFIGATGGFKSGLLLNLMRQFMVYNTGRTHKDPTKQPTVLFLSQENNIWETIQRLYGIFGKEDNGNMKDHSLSEIMAILKSGGFRTSMSEQDVNIEFRYYGNHDIGVDDIRGMVSDLDAAGCEVIGVIQDYIERLRPPVALTEKRNQLADISNQLHDLAVDLDIPVITASQFNRDGVETIEKARDSDKRDIGKLVGSGNVSESYGMLKNFDVNISIVVELDRIENRYYLSFRALKFRGDDTNSIKYFLQPFEGSARKIKLMDDINATEPLYKLSMIDETNARPNKVISMERGIETVDRTYRRDDEEETFEMVEPVRRRIISEDEVQDEAIDAFMVETSHSMVRETHIDNFGFIEIPDNFPRDVEGFVPFRQYIKPNCVLYNRGPMSGEAV